MSCCVFVLRLCRASLFRRNRSPSSCSVLRPWSFGPSEPSRAEPSRADRLAVATLRCVHVACVSFHFHRLRRQLKSTRRSSGERARASRSAERSQANISIIIAARAGRRTATTTTDTRDSLERLVVSRVATQERFFQLWRSLDVPFGAGARSSSAACQRAR